MVNLDKNILKIELKIVSREESNKLIKSYHVSYFS